MRRVFVATGLVALAVLGACAKKPDQPAPAPQAAAPTAAPAQPSAEAAASPAAPLAVITADQIPTPKLGLWERVSVQDADPPQTDRKCMGGKPIDPMEGGPKCAKVDISRTATGGFVLDADCPNNGVDARLHTSAEGDFNSAYTSDSTMTLSQAGTPDVVTKNHSTWKYVGACAAGQTPGT